MASSPRVSLLIPTFNSGLTIADAIESCRAQTFQDFEIVIYDEASKDNTREIIEQAARAEPRLRFYSSETNSGPVRAWQRLLQEARGKYSSFVWADDLILPRHVETLLGMLERNPSQLIAACNAYSETLPATVAGMEGKNILTGEASRFLLHHFPSGRIKADVFALGILTAVYPVSPICAMYDTAKARDVIQHYIDFDNPYGFNFSRKAYGNDVAFMSELGLLSGEVEVCSEPLVACRASPSSMTVNAHRDHRWQYWLAYVWAIRASWERCRGLSPRMDAAIQVVDDRVRLCDFVYSLKKKSLPKQFNPWKILRAMWFVAREDFRINKKVGPASLEAYLARHS